MESRFLADGYRLHPMQQGMLFHSVLERDGGVYVGQVLAVLPQGVDLHALERAWQRVVDRNAVLRTGFHWEESDDALQVPHENVPFAMKVYDWRHIAPAEEPDRLREHLVSDGNDRFDLARPPLMRFALFRLSQGEHKFLWTHHHALLDGRARVIVLKEVSQFYEAFLRNQDLELPPPVAYKDYIEWFYRQDRTETRQYWRRLLGEVTSDGLLTSLFEAGASYSGERYGEREIQILPALKASLLRMAQREKVTVSMILQAVWSSLLGRYTGAPDVIFGETRACRRPAFKGAAGVVGVVMNTVPIRLRVSPSRPFRELLEDLRDQHVALREHEHAALADIRDWIGMSKTVEMLDSIVVFEEYELDGVLRREGAALWERGIHRNAPAHYPLALAGYNKPELLLRMVHDRSKVGELSVERIVGHLTTLLDGAVKEPDAWIGALPLLTESELRQIAEWNGTWIEYPDDWCIHEMFEEQVARTPEAPALAFEEQEMSYGELNRRANQLAHYLRELGVRPDTRVAICVERSFEMIVGVLGVLKAGGAYVPLDPGFPSERLSYMLKDSAPAVLLTQSHLQRLFADKGEGLQMVDMGRTALEWKNRPEVNPGAVSVGLRGKHLAYVIYTSGSTGKAKGVGVEHCNAVNLIRWGQRVFSREVLRKTLFSTSLNFDVAVYEIYVPLTVGGRLRVVPDALELAHRDEEVTLIDMVPSVMKALLEAENVLRTVRVVNLGGEVLKRALVEEIFATTDVDQVCNLYGPTETTTYSTWVEMKRGEGFAEHIGRPIGNTRIYILDSGLGPVPVGVPGELCIGGAGVARGYLNRAELTAERFIPDPYIEDANGGGARMYRTGDIGRWRADGNIEFLGRNDFQIKIRGFRVETGEIEARLAEHEGVREAVVLAREDTAGEKRLVAYYTSRHAERAVDGEELRVHLSAGLPEYMVPAAYVSLQSFPLTPTGKLDRRSLPAPEMEAFCAGGYEEPRGEMETKLAGIWAEILKLERVGRHDHFFSLGGHSLLAVRMTSRVRRTVGAEVTVRDLFAHPRLADLARVLESSGRSDLPSIRRAERSERLPLSFAQQRLWFLAQMEGVSEAYHIPFGVRLKGRLNRVALRQTLERIVERHEALRTTFILVEEQAVQRITSVQESGFRLAEQIGSESELDRVMAEEIRRAFDLERGPLIRGLLIEMAEDEHVLLLTIHHIVFDGWSMEILGHELSALYGACVRGEADPLEPPAIQYADYAVWQREWIEGEILREQGDYWKKALAGAPELLDLPADRPRTALQDYAGARMELALDEKLTTRLRGLSRRRGTTLYMTLLAGWAALLSRLSGQAEVVIGSPVANRGHAETEKLIGLFVNTLAVRIELPSSLTVKELLERVKEQTLAARQNQDIPFEKVVELMQPARSLAHSPLFQVMFVWQNMPEEKPAMPGLELQLLRPAGQRMAKFDLTLSLWESGEGIVGGVEYATALWEAATMERYVGYFRRLLEGIVRDESQRVERLAILAEAERDQLLYAWNETKREFPGEPCVQELFEEQVERTPKAIAVVFEGRELSYEELNRCANQLAHYLRELGAGPDVRVAICAERSVEMIVGLLGILKAGGAYVPLDPAFPVERLHYMLRDCAPVALLAQNRFTGWFTGNSGLAIVDLEAEPWAGRCTTNPERSRTGLTADHLAYVIYTSGSTGKPKGVMNQHRGVVNRLRWGQEAYKLKAGEAVLQKTPYSFDVSVWEFFWPLLAGARLVSARPEGHKDANYLQQIIKREEITTLHFVPSMLQVFLEQVLPGTVCGLKRVMCSGEALPAALVRRFRERLPETELHNLYGPTEAAVEVTAWACGMAEIGTVLIGEPIANARIYILDSNGGPAPIGIWGEIHIGGLPVARGYLNRAELTAEKFVPDPYIEDAKHGGARMYRTGDIGRRRADGNIEFLGRNDFQVKIRGFRIEPGEIEARLAEHEGVREAVVLAREDTAGDKRLVAYYTSRQPERAVDSEELRTHLSAGLPEYMVPAAYVWMKSLPLTTSGKVNLKALPAPEDNAFAVRRYEAPVGAVEENLAAIWAEVLKVRRVGRHDNFFALGGHSLLATRMISSVRSSLGVELSTRSVFEAPCIAKLAKIIEELIFEEIVQMPETKAIQIAGVLSREP